MTWIKQRVWQLGIAAVLILVGSVVIYLTNSATSNPFFTWVGLGLTWFGLLIPVLSKIFGSDQAEEEG